MSNGGGGGDTAKGAIEMKENELRYVPEKYPKPKVQMDVATGHQQKSQSSAKPVPWTIFHTLN
jgi:hypothetical protein